MKSNRWSVTDLWRDGERRALVRWGLAPPGGKPVVAFFESYAAAFNMRGLMNAIGTRTVPSAERAVRQMWPL